MASNYSPRLTAINSQRGSWGSNLYGPFAYNQQLWSFQLLPVGGNFFIAAFRSTDFGNTWVEVDSANHPRANSLTAVFDGVHTVTVAFCTPVAVNAVHFCNFDLNAGTWGAIYGTGAGGPASAANVGSLMLRPDGSLVVTWDWFPIPALPASNFWCGVFSVASPAGAWLNQFDLGVNMAADAAWIVGSSIITVQTGTVADSTGALHSFFTNPASGLWYYQRVTSLDVLDVFHKFTENLQVFSGMPIGIPLINGDALYLPAVIRDAMVRNYPLIYTGTPLSAPVFTPGPPPGAFNATAAINHLYPDNVPRIQFDNTGRLIMVWMAYDGGAPPAGDFSDLYVSINSDPTVTPFTGWITQLVWARSLNSPPGFNYNGQQVQLAGLNVTVNRQLLITTDANNPTAPHTEQAYWMGVFSVGLSPVFTDPGVIPLPDPTKAC
jgi:hypothetical protein